MLITLCVVAVVGFLLTRAAARANHVLRFRDAAAWYEAGGHQLVGGQTETAVTALRRAASINRDNRTYRLALAAALGANHQEDAARQVLLGLRETTPEDPEVNVRLARLAARHDDLTGAVRYYQNAVYGSWGVDQTDARRQVRIELIQYLLAHKQRGRALSELLVLNGNLPDDVQSQAETGQLFLAAGDPRRALERFRQALRIDPKNGVALVGAGEAAFDAGDYASARRYLQAVHPRSSRVTELLTVTDLVLTRDPLRAGLSLLQRHERLSLAFKRAVEVLDECVEKGPANNDLESLRTEAKTLEPDLVLGKLGRSPESFEIGLNLVYRIEQAADTCGRRSPFDRALLLIGRRHEADR